MASAHVLRLSTAPCPSISGLRAEVGVECQRKFNKGEGVVQGNAAGFQFLVFSFWPSILREQRFMYNVLTINWVGHILWSIYNMI